MLLSKIRFRVLALFLAFIHGLADFSYGVSNFNCSFMVCLRFCYLNLTFLLVLSIKVLHAVAFSYCFAGFSF